MFPIDVGGSFYRWSNFRNIWFINSKKYLHFGPEIVGVFIGIHSTQYILFLEVPGIYLTT